MASVHKRAAASGPRYDVSYREADGRQRKRTFRRRTDADRFAATVEADILRGTYLDPDAGHITFKRYAEDWLGARSFEPTTREQVALRLRVHVYPVLGPKLLSQIRPSTIQAWLSTIDGAAATRRVILANVSAILSAAVDDERISKNPCKAGSVRAPRPEARKVSPWTVEQVGAVREQLPEHYRIALDLAVGLGLRQGEVFGLSPDDVDFLRGTVEVQRQVKLLNGNVQVFGLPKGSKSRTVPLPSSVRDLLASHLAVHRARAVTLPWREPGGKTTTPCTPRSHLTRTARAQPKPLQRVCVAEGPGSCRRSRRSRQQGCTRCATTTQVSF